MGHFTKATFDFLFDLDVHNDKAWFEQHRGDFEQHVKEPMLAFIADIADPLHRRVSRHLLAIPKMQGGSMFRIHRDTRFTDDQRPTRGRSSDTTRPRTTSTPPGCTSTSSPATASWAAASTGRRPRS